MRDKKLGQNFLINNRIAMEIAQALDAKKNEKVLEIGGGKGILTEQLTKKTRNLTVVELDERLAEELEEKFGEKCKISNSDALDCDFSYFDAIVGNIPYYISSDVIVKFLESKCEKAILMVQKEFGEKLLLEDRDARRTRLNVMVSTKCIVEKLLEVEKGNFQPVPKVDSIVIKIQKKPKKMQLHLNERLVNALFQHKNQNIKKALKHSSKFLGIQEEKLNEFAGKAVEKLGLEGKSGSQLSLKELDELSKEFERI